MALRLTRAVSDFNLRGHGWRRLGLSASVLPYGAQADHIRAGALSVVWDHWPYLPDYPSDRLPIALIAGRAHVTVRHPGMAWAPSESAGSSRQPQRGSALHRCSSRGFGRPPAPRPLGGAPGALASLGGRSPESREVVPGRDSSPRGSPSHGPDQPNLSQADQTNG